MKMKTIAATLSLVLLSISGFSATVVLAPLQVNKTTGALPVGSKFIPGNSNAIVDVVGQNMGLASMLVVSPNGNDGSAVAGNAARPFATIGAALAQAQNNSIVQILPGTYAQTGVYLSAAAASGFGSLPAVLQNKTNVTITGNGAIITGSGDICHLGLYNCKDVTVSGLTFELTKGVGLSMSNGYVGAFCLFGTNWNITCKGVAVRGATDQGMTTSRRVYGWLVDGCSFYNIGSTNCQYVTNAVSPPYVDGTAISGLGSDSRIVNNRFEDCFRCVEWDDVANSVYNHSGMVVANNFMTNTFDTSIFTYSPQTNATTLRDIQIMGNTIYQCQDARGVNSHTWPGAGNRFDYGIKLDVGKNVVIADNIIRGVHDYSIVLSSAAPVENVSIKGNVIEGNTGTTTTNSNNGGILIQDLGRADNYNQIKGVTITGNTIRNLGNRAMHLSGYDVNVVGNTVKDCQQLNTGGLYDFFVDGSAYHASNIVFRTNFRNDNRTSTPKNYALGVSTGVQQIFWDSSNLSLNCNTTTAPTNYPLAVASAAYQQVYFNGKSGAVTLSGSGTASIVFPMMRSTTKLNLTRATTGGTPGHLSYVITAGTGAVVTSSSASDTSVINWQIAEETP